MKRGYWLALSTILLGLSCLPPNGLSTDGVPIIIDVGEQVSAVTPEGTGCHSGTFECANGPEVASCGTWMFDVNEMGAISGTGSITSPVSGATVNVVVSGIVDPGVNTLELALASDGGGAGTINVSYDGASLDLTGTWSFRDGPEPSGDEIEGGVSGTSCVQIQ